MFRSAGPDDAQNEGGGQPGEDECHAEPLFVLFFHLFFHHEVVLMVLDRSFLSIVIMPQKTTKIQRKREKKPFFDYFRLLLIIFDGKTGRPLTIFCSFYLILGKVSVSRINV